MPEAVALTRVYLNIAKEIASLSNCVSYQVGAVITRDGRILSTGYNGTPKGYKNCKQVFPNYIREFHREDHHEFSNMFEIHAEMNAILFAARRGIDIKGSTLYCTCEPCVQCAKNIIQSGITKVIYASMYDKNEVIREKINNFYKACRIDAAYFDGEKLIWNT